MGNTPGKAMTLIGFPGLHPIPPVPLKDPSKFEEELEIRNGKNGQNVGLL